MAWETPKTDWAPDDVVSDTDLNRIENDLEFLNGIAHSAVFTGTIPNDTAGDINATGITPSTVVAIVGTFYDTYYYPLTMGLQADHAIGATIIMKSDGVLRLISIASASRGKSYRILVLYTGAASSPSSSASAS